MWAPRGDESPTRKKVIGLSQLRLYSTGCTCAQRVLDAHDAAEHASLRKVAYVAVSDVRRCAVELRVEDATSSGEHKWKLVRLSIGFMSAADLQ